jgi:hypothetical protein
VDLPVTKSRCVSGVRKEVSRREGGENGERCLGICGASTLIELDIYSLHERGQLWITGTEASEEEGRKEGRREREFTLRVDLHSDSRSTEYRPFRTLVASARLISLHLSELVLGE